MTEDNRDHIGRTHSGLVPGLIVAGIGVLFLLNNLRIVRVYEWWQFWPVILIAIGVTRLVDSQTANERTGGAIMLVIGGMRSMTGAVVGVIIVSLLSEVLRNLERGIDFGIVAVPPLYGASQIVLGIIFILIMIFRPSGVMGDLELSFGRIGALLHKARKE